MTIQDIPKHRLYRNGYIQRCIQYEAAPGTHTYHLCQTCKKSSCRALQCKQCWWDLLRKMEAS